MIVYKVKRKAEYFFDFGHSAYMSLGAKVSPMGKAYAFKLNRTQKNTMDHVKNNPFIYKIKPQAPKKHLKMILECAIDAKDLTAYFQIKKALK